MVTLADYRRWLPHPVRDQWAEQEYPDLPPDPPPAITQAEEEEGADLVALASAELVGHIPPEIVSILLAVLEDRGTGARIALRMLRAVDEEARS